MLNIRRVGEVADGSVTAAKLADSAVDLSSSKVVGELPSNKLADSAVVESKLADLSISTAKLKDSVVTLAKASDDVKISASVGDETEVSVTGIVEQAVKGLSFPKKANYALQKIRTVATLKTNDALKEAKLSVYVDAETVSRLDLTSTSIVYELVDGIIDISDLPTGKHSISLRLVSAAADGIASNDMVDVLYVQ